MGRTLRRVTPDWKHPKDARGNYEPLFDGMTFEQKLRDWHNGGDPECKPEPEHYTPSTWGAQATHFQMYETTTEGTPESPVFATVEEVARWCAEHTTAWADQRVSYERWLEICSY